MLRPTTAIAAGGFALLAVFRLAEGTPLWAGVLAALALVQLAVGFLVSARSRRAATRAAGADPHGNRLRRRVWLAIAAVGWLAGIVAALMFPPLSLVLTAVALFATLRGVRLREAPVHAKESQDIARTPTVEAGNVARQA